MEFIKKRPNFSYKVRQNYLTPLQTKSSTLSGVGFILYFGIFPRFFRS
ncbi:hypothetical protein FM107_16030 [Sphingobacterium sp. JB170]|nr:hypothetical protein FM107_16030 [Sphingobacterium sp. JB170]